MLTENTNAKYQTTSWTLVNALSGEDQQSKQHALELLVNSYWAPVYAFIRRKGHAREEAVELTQEFFTEKIVERNLFGKANKDRGKLRSLLCKSISNFLINEHQKNSKGGNTSDIPLDRIAREETLLSVNSITDPSDAFDKRWALALLDEALLRCDDALCNEDRKNHWHAFEKRIKHPAVSSTTPPPLSEIAEELNFSTPALVAAAVQMVKRRLNVILHQVIAETAIDESDVESEFQQVIEILKV